MPLEPTDRTRAATARWRRSRRRGRSPCGGGDRDGVGVESVDAGAPLGRDGTFDSGISAGATTARRAHRSEEHARREAVTTPNRHLRDRRVRSNSQQPNFRPIPTFGPPTNLQRMSAPAPKAVPASPSAHAQGTNPFADTEDQAALRQLARDVAERSLADGPPGRRDRGVPAGVVGRDAPGRAVRHHDRRTVGRRRPRRHRSRDRARGARPRRRLERDPRPAHLQRPPARSSTSAPTSSAIAGSRPPRAATACSASASARPKPAPPSATCAPASRPTATASASTPTRTT